MTETASAESRVPLLGQLAGEVWFMRRGEVAATWSLTCLASDARLRASILSYLGDRFGIDLATAERFVAETVQEDLSRPDIEMFDREATPSASWRPSSALN